MAYDLVWVEEALDQLQDAYDYLDDLEEGLGDELMESLEAIQDRILERPMLYPLLGPRVRRALTNRFSYALFYHFDEERVIVLAFLHTSRSTEHWPL